MNKDDTSGAFGDMYCKKGHKGPLCEVCAEEGFYFNEDDGKCEECPSLRSIIVLLITALLVNAAIIFLVHVVIMSFGASSLYLDVLSSLSLQAKLKLLVSFSQILSSFGDVYGIQLHSELAGWMDLFFKYLSLDFLQIIEVPISCIGSTRLNLVAGVMWPYVILIIGAVTVFVYRLCVFIMKKSGSLKPHAESNTSSSSSEQTTNFFVDVIGPLKRWTIKWAIIIFYLVIPTVSIRIFDAIKCRAFDDDDEGASVSYLLNDMEIQCNDDDSIYGSILGIFWVLFVIWIVLTPLGFLVLLTTVHEAVRSMKISSLADSCRFLWQDYDSSMIFWDVIDTWRKIFLTGCIMLIDTQEGSNKLLRLVIANIVSLLYFGILLAFHPYKNDDNYYVAFLSNFLLICCFSLGIILKLCDEDHNGEEDGIDKIPFCSRYIGLSLDSYNASILVIVLAFSMFITTTGMVVVLAVRRVRAPTVRVVSTGYAPNLELPEECKYHVYMSYANKTGQAQTRDIVRRMKDVLPGLRVRLNSSEEQILLVDEEQEIEEVVAVSAVFVIFYSENYFRYKNCQRALYAAIKFKKPIVLLYKGDSESPVEGMIEACTSNCDGDDSPGSDVILQKLLYSEDDILTDNSTPSLSTTASALTRPIRWIEEGAFAAKALNSLFYRIISNLPYYGIDQDELEKGIMVPGEIGPVSLNSPINLLIYEGNDGCFDIVDELRATVPVGNSADMIRTHDAAEFLWGKKAEVASEEEEEEEEEEEDDSETMGFMSSSTRSNAFDAPTFLLLYLNEHTFEGHDANQDESDQTMLIRFCLEHQYIKVLLVHEQDIAKGGCRIDLFYRTAPQKLINPPFNLFERRAIKLYPMEDYRSVSLRMIIQRMIAK